MPKSETKKIEVKKEYFMAVINAKGYSLRSLQTLYTSNSLLCSERTLRRSLTAKKIRPIYIETLAKILDVDPRYLTGSILKEDPDLSRVKNVSADYYLSMMDKYPYSRKDLDELRNITVQNHLKSLLALFDFSYKQFDSLSFDDKYSFQLELFESIIPILSKYFKEDAFGNEERPALETLIYSLNSFYENECELRSADTTVREMYYNNPPVGYTPEQIKAMSREEISDLDFTIQNINSQNNTRNNEFDDYFEKKYSSIPLQK